MKRMQLHNYMYINHNNVITVIPPLKASVPAKKNNKREEENALIFLCLVTISIQVDELTIKASQC